MMSRLFLTIARFLLSAWVGAAALFVIVAIRQTTSFDVDSVVRDRLALLRFPPYYAFGFGAVGGAAVCLAPLLGGRILSKPRVAAALLLAITSLGLMTYDYRAVYRPLAQMVTPPGSERPAEFQMLHARSEMINSLHVGCCLLAALVLNWPRADTKNESGRT